MNNMFYYPPYPFEEEEIRGNEELFTPIETLEYGNLFKNEYSQYQNYKPYKINQSKLVNLIAMEDYLHDIKLYLDIYPNDKNMERLYLDSKNKYEDLKRNVDLDNLKCPILEKEENKFNPLKYLLWG